MNIEPLKSSKLAKTFSANHVIAIEGDTSNDAMYIILEGTANVYKDYGAPTQSLLADLTAGHFFGEATFFLHTKRLATVVSATEMVVLEIGRVSAFEFFKTQPQLTYAISKSLCLRLHEAGCMEATGGLSVPLFTVSAPAPAPPKPTPKPAPVAPPISANEAGLPADLFPSGHKLYNIVSELPSTDFVYKKSFVCPVCENKFMAYSMRQGRLRAKGRDKDFRNHYDNVDPIYFEVVTCPSCWYSNLDTAYSQPIVSRFKESIGELTKYKADLGINISEDRSINSVFAGHYLALKGAPLFYKQYEMFAAKLWLRLKWLYADAEDKEMELYAAKEAQKAYLLAFEKTDTASPEALQQLCVLMGELSLFVKDIPNAKLFFVKARGYRNGPKALLSQAEDGIETIRKIEAGVLRI